MTDYERIRKQFNASTACRWGQRPRLDYDPGCLFIECAESDKCRCCMADGDGGTVSAFLIRWRERYAK
jgi:hypothetical protein